MCSCSKSKQGGTGQKWVVTRPNNSTETYSSETDARMAAASEQGSRVRLATT